MKLFAVRGERLGGGRGEGRRNITDKIHNQSSGDRNFLLMPTKKGDLQIQL